MAFSQRGRPEINVTPLIDVLLVLLVIFLIVIPNLVKYEEVTTPTPQELGGEYAPSLVVRVRADLSMVLVDEGREIPLDAGGQLAVGLRQHLREHHHVMFVELEDEVPWGEVVAAVDTIHGVAPMTRVALKVPDE
jgi:biopolymer transport protein TolR